MDMRQLRAIVVNRFMLEMAQRLTFTDGISQLPLPQESQFRSDHAGGDSSSVSPLSFVLQSSDLPIRSIRESFQESKYQWPSRDNSSELRTPFATKDGEPQGSAETRNESKKRKKRSHNEDENTPNTKGQKRIRARKKAPSDDRHKADVTTQDSFISATCELDSLAKSLADDTPLGQLMEDTFTECDARMKEREQTLAMIGMAAPTVDGPQGKEAADNKIAGSGTEKHGFHFDVVNAKIWNICAERIRIAIEKEKALRNKRGIHHRSGCNPGKISPRLTVWRD
ncbi:MAG: hypothetical protein GOMPHAMPRED_000423 [Gomphillus americanus]|uniref:Uncharacterized protein n=1 Tax=Gomphillus americanus TaxID=1940652 RepID=A0A8H3I522_9LECA|nr:MAG: hypothetical protein GOMPHAMPRED_000423 [Gomphillus americanus]